MEEFQKWETDVEQQQAMNWDDRTLSQERLDKIEPITSFIDTFREQISSDLSETDFAAFRLGEVLEAGLLPIELVTEDPVIEPQQFQSRLPIEGGQQGTLLPSFQIGGPRQSLRRPRFRIAVALPEDCNGIRPWEATWVCDVATALRMCCISQSSLDLQTEIANCNTDAMKRIDYIQNLIKVAMDHYKKVEDKNNETPLPTRSIRLLSSCNQKITFSVNGHTYEFDNLAELQLLHDLYYAPARRLTTVH
jgi:hypothetical protein